MTEIRYASLKPSDMVEGGGLIQDEDLIVTGAQFTIFDYNGKAPAVPALELVLHREEEGGGAVKQYYSVGKLTDWQPTEDGKGIAVIGKAEGISLDSNFGHFSLKLVNAGFPENKLLLDISVLVGLKAHFMREPAPKRSGLKREGGEGREDTILVPDKILKLPWEADKEKKGQGKTSFSSAPAPGPATESGGNDQISEMATEFVLEQLASHPEGISKNQLPTAAFMKYKADKSIDAKIRNAVVKLVNEDVYLSGIPLWKYEGGKVLPLQYEYNSQ